MTISDKATIFEQSYTMYNRDDPKVIYWRDWAKKFIDCCKNKMGWEVAVGPGTSFGAVMINVIHSSNGMYIAPHSCGCSAWDCDWTQQDGIVQQYQSSNDKNDGKYPKFTGWFHSNYFNNNPWPDSADEYGADETGRFDFIIYTGEGSNGEKIGFRIKYPICSIGYSGADNSMTPYPGNLIYGAPAISLYSSTKGNIESYYPDTLITSATRYNTSEDIYNHSFSGSGYVTLFSKYSPVLYNDPYGLLNNLFWGKSDINDTRAPTSTTQLTSILWSLELQSDVNFTKNSGYKTSTGGAYVGTNAQRLFVNYWKKYNKFNYHFSQSGDTNYMYISDDTDTDVGLKIITSTLENGEKMIIIERRQISEEETLCEMAAVTSGINNSSSQPQNNLLIKLPIRPYKKVTSQTNRFSFSKLLLPTQVSLCTDLYYVTKKDIDETILDGQYVLVKDKQSSNHYFRVIPFGAKEISEIVGDNTTYLAFPVIDPPKDDGGE